MTGSRLGLALLLLAALCETGCMTTPPAAGIENRDWFLVAIGKNTDVAPTQAARPTLRLEGTRAAGFAGCNHFAGSYTIDGDHVHFGPSASTKMHCADTARIEDEYLAAFDRVTRWSVSEDGELTLSSDKGPLLRFREMSETRRTK